MHIVNGCCLSGRPRGRPRAALGPGARRAEDEPRRAKTCQAVTNYERAISYALRNQNLKILELLNNIKEFNVDNM